MRDLRVRIVAGLWWMLFVCVFYVQAHNTHKPKKKTSSHDHHDHHDHGHDHDHHNHSDHSGHHHSDHSDHHQEEDECLHLEHGEYSMSAHIMAIFILIIVSLIGSVGPVIIHFITCNKGDTRNSSETSRFVVRLGILFGAGTILSTGFIHMLVPAVENLTNECLPSLWTEDYRSFAPVFAIAGILLMQLMQHGMVSFYQRMSDSRTHPTLDKDEKFALPSCAHGHHHHASDTNNSTETNSPETVNYSKRVAVALLEIGIAIHSIIVGIALGVAREPEFYPLLIALCFHQFFEGLALGTTVIDANYKSKLKSILMTGIYGVTTPLGIAIGIFIHHSYNANSPESLLIQGIFDSVSAGILIYTALVELLTPQITNSSQFRKHSFWQQFMQFMAVWMGAAAMAIVGKYA